MDTFIRNLFSTFAFIFAFPYKIRWEHGFTTRLSLKTLSPQYILWLLSSAFCVIYFCITTSFLVHLSPVYLASKHYDKLAFHGIWILFAFCFVNQQAPYLRGLEEVMQLSNGLVELVKNLETNHFGPGVFQKSQLVRSGIIYYLGLNCLASVSTLWPLIYYHFRREFWQAGSYIYRLVLWLTEMPEEKDNLASLFSMTFDTWQLYHAWGGYLFSLHLNLAFMHTFKTTIAIMITKGSNEKDLSLIKQLQEKMLIYRKLRILTTVFNNVFGMTYVPTLKTIISMMTSASIFISVGLAPRSPLVVGIFGVSMGTLGIVSMTMFIMFTAMVNEYSVKFRKHLKNGELHGKLARRILRSYKEEAVKSGEFYKIQRITCLTVLGFMSNMCGSMLISVKI